MKKIIITIVMALFVFSTNAKAEGAKIGVDYLKLSTELSPAEFDTSAVQARFSTGVAPNFEIEGVIAFGISDDTYNTNDPVLLGDFSLTTKLASMLGVFAKVHSDPFSGFQVFGRIGLARLDFDVDVDTQNFGSGSASYDDTGLAFGVGVSYNFSERSAIVAEYSILPDVDFEGEDVETDAISIGLQFAF